MSSKTYVVSWDRVYDNSLAIEKQLAKAGLDYLIYNDSSEPDLNNNWVRADKVFFLGHLYNSMKDFLESGKDVFIFNAGDPIYENYEGLTRKAEKIFKDNPNVWAYAPSTDGEDVWSWEGSSIARSEVYPGLVLSTHTNAIWLAMSRELVELGIKFFDWMFDRGSFDKHFQRVNTGWGMDSFFCALSICLGKLVYRDWDISVRHDARTSYDHQRAMQEMDMTLRESMKFVENLGIDPERLKSLYNLMYNKVWTKQQLTVGQVYESEDLKY